MRILVSGASGLVGSALASHLEATGHEVIGLSRRDGSGAGRPQVRWDPAAGEIDQGGLAGLDAVVHLAGENVASGRWTTAQKERILDSRVGGTRLLCEALAGLEPRPATLVAASAIGYYGDRGEELLTEESPPGVGFLAEVCRGWEAAAEPAREAGVRVVHPRIGMVLSPSGGALAKMLPPFRAGLGGRVGSGRQWVSWITLDDLVSAIEHLLVEGEASGPWNTVAPEPVTNRGLARSLARALGRPAWLPLPAFAARALLGEMADELLLASTRVDAGKLLSTGFRFRHRHLDAALEELLARR